MGMTQKLIEMFGVPAVISTLQEKDPSLLVLVDKLDELSLPQALGAFVDARKDMPDQPSEIDWNRHVVNLLTVKPAIVAIAELLKDLEIEEISGINIMDIVKGLADYEDTE